MCLYSFEDLEDELIMKQFVMICSCVKTSVTDMVVITVAWLALVWSSYLHSNDSHVLCCNQMKKCF